MMSRKNACRFFGAGMGAIATAGAVVTSYLATTHCPVLNSSIKTLIEPVITGPLHIKGSLAMNVTVFKSIKVDISSTDLTLQFFLKMNEHFREILTSVPETAETTCKVGVAIIGSMLTIDAILGVALIGYAGKKIYDYAHDPVHDNHQRILEEGYHAALDFPL